MDDKPRFYDGIIPENAIIIHGFNYAGAMSSDCTIGPFPCPFDEKQIERIFRHGWWMCVLWVILYFFMTALNRWYVYISNNNNYLHSLIGWLIIVASIFDITDIFIHDHIIYVTNNHRLPAYFMIFPGLLGFAVTGMASFFAKKLLRWDTQTVVLI